MQARLRQRPRLQNKPAGSSAVQFHNGAEQAVEPRPSIKSAQLWTSEGPSNARSQPDDFQDCSVYDFVQND